MKAVKSIFIIAAFLTVFALYLSIYSLCSNGAGDGLNINAARDIGGRFSKLFGFNLSAKCDFAYLDATSERYLNFIILTPAGGAAKKLRGADFSGLNANAKDFLSFKADVDSRKKFFQNISEAQSAELQRLLNGFMAADLRDVAVYRGEDKFGGYDFAYNIKSNLLIYICGE